jgi:hypothetical protein
MDKQLKYDINESIMARAQGIGLAGSLLVPPVKIVGADPGLCTLLLLDSYGEEGDEPALFMYAKFFASVLEVDNISG